MGTNTFDLAVVGGGASGLAAAIEAKRANAALWVAVLEKAPKVGQKILATGNGRCNFSNAHIAPQNYNEDAAPLLALAQGFADDEAFFRSMGVLPRADEAGRLYPGSNAASAVLDALRLTAQQLGICVLSSFEVTGLEQFPSGGFAVSGLADDGEVAVQDMQSIQLLKAGQIVRKDAAGVCGVMRNAKSALPQAARNGTTAVFAARVILAAGGPAGLRGDGRVNAPLFDFLRRTGHALVPFAPALAPVPTEESRTAALKGQRVRAAVTLEQGGRPLQSASGEVSFGAGQLSGICVMDLSARAVPGCVLRLDLVPDLDEQTLCALLLTLSKVRAGFALEDLMTGFLPKRICQQLLKTAGLPLTQPSATLRPAKAAALAQLIKNWRFPVTGRAAWQAAQVAAGGVPSESVGAGLQSRSVPGLYLCGELLDVCGDCGGFNLHWAWMSGRCAGHAAACAALATTPKIAKMHKSGAVAAKRAHPHSKKKK